MYLFKKRKIVMEMNKPISIKIPLDLWTDLQRAKLKKHIKSVSAAAIEGLTLIAAGETSAQAFTGERLRRISKCLKDKGHDMDAAWDIMESFLVADKNFKKDKLLSVIEEVFNENWEA